MVDDAIELKRLRWRCRRGMRELDVLFNAWLDRVWPTASEAERAVFLQLLDCEDDKVWRWCMGYEDLPDGALGALVEQMRQLQSDIVRG